MAEGVEASPKERRGLLGWGLELLALTGFALDAADPLGAGRRA